MLKRRAIRAYKRLFVRTGFYGLYRRLFLVSLWGLGVLNSEDYTESGEAYFLARLPRYVAAARPLVVFDIGAHVGDYAALGKAQPPTAPPRAFGPRAMERGTQLLAGARDDLCDLPLDLATVPEFHRRVYEVARAIPPGEVLTYGEVAKRLGDPGASRAVGQALGSNPFAPVVPCHRVLAAGGRSGGFSAEGGAITKLKMLEIEGARLGAGPGLFGPDRSIFRIPVVDQVSPWLTPRKALATSTQVQLGAHMSRKGTGAATSQPATSTCLRPKRSESRPAR